MTHTSVVAHGVRAVSLSCDTTIENLTAEWQCVKRDGRTVAFDAGKISHAVGRCFEAVGLTADDRPALIDRITRGVIANIAQRSLERVGVEEVQRFVIAQLWAEGLFDAAEHYQNYREEHRRRRLHRPIPEETQARFDRMRAHFPSDLQVYQLLGKFSRWREADGRRETWHEVVHDRVMPWFKKTLRTKGHDLTPSEWQALTDGMYNLEASPAMRVVQMAGPALDRCNMGVYNCTAMPIKDLFSFPEMLYVLMQGCGLGFSVEDEYVSQLPRIKPQRKGAPRETIVVEDDTEGWCNAYFEGLQRWWEGYDVWYNTDKVRKAGSRLRTKGGRSAGPGPFLELMAFARNLITAKQGRCLDDTDAHRLACFTARIVQVGGVRRAATISLSDLKSAGMRHIKSGDWYSDRTYWTDGRYLTMANNCLPVGTLVHTDRGPIAIEKLRVGDTVVTAAGSAPVAAVQDSGRRETVLISHAMGEFECTPEHRVAVFDTVATWSFKPAKDVRPGDALVFDHNGCDGVKTSLPDWPRHRFSARRRQITIPELTPEISWAIGLFQGDGNTSVMHYQKAAAAIFDNRADSIFGAPQTPSCGKVVIACPLDDLDLQIRCRRALEQFGVRTKVGRHKSKWGECAVVCANSVELALYLRQYVKKSKSPLDVPPWIMTGTRTVRAAYLAGLIDSDGSTKDTTVEIASIYVTFLEQLRALAASLGICAKLRRSCKGRNGSKPVHKLLFYGVENRRRLDAAVGIFSSRYASTPPPIPQRSHNEFSYPMATVDASGIDVSRMTGACRPLAALRRSHAVTPLASPVLVRAVRPSGRKVQVYDIEVARIAQFTAEGFVVHNSAVYEEKPSMEAFMEEWLALVKSKSGERGIFNRRAAELHKPARRASARWVMNPCGEIIFRPYGVCNLTIAVARPGDTEEDLARKVTAATYFGVLQSLCTDFRYVRPEWKANAEEERLLGVDITGHADCPLLRYGAPGRADLLRRLQARVAEVALPLSRRFGINYSAANTTVKPSGDSAIFFNCASGVSPWFSRYQVRWVREQRDSPIARFLIDAGVPHAPAPEAPDRLLVFGFPREAPEGCTLRDDMTAVQQLENWLEWKRNWAEHSVSATVYVDEHEWLAVGNWVYEHFDWVTGLTFLPKDNGVYTYAPNEELTEEKFRKFVRDFPKLNWAKLVHYEEDDMTAGAQAFACTAGGCDF